MLRDAAWERFHVSHVHATMPIGRFPSGEGGSMRTPRMRTFVSGLVFMPPAAGVLAAVSPGPALAGTPQPGREGSLPGSLPGPQVARSPARNRTPATRSSR
jgi:hypothetical protein